MILLFERSLGLSRCECVWQGLNPGLAVFFHISSPLVTSVMQCFPQNYVAFGAVPKAGATHRLIINTTTLIVIVICIFLAEWIQH